jgi:hypothetical protein
MRYIIIRIIAIVLLIWALDEHPYGYYTLLRFAVCGVSAYSVYFAIKIKNEGWAWTFGVIAILFNPIIPVHLDRQTWKLIDVGVAIVFLISLFSLRKIKSENNDIDASSPNSV